MPRWSKNARHFRTPKSSSRSKSTPLQAIDNKTDDLKTKLNLVKKNDEYKALQNQIAHESCRQVEDRGRDPDLARGSRRPRGRPLASSRPMPSASAREVAALQKQIDNEAVSQKAQLEELETAIVQAENVIPEEYRVQYRRIVARYGPDALAVCDEGSCLGCYTSLTAQMVNDLMNGTGQTFCLSCGRLLYLAEPIIVTTKRSKA